MGRLRITEADQELTDILGVDNGLTHRIMA
jgi:hypothetical protein